MKTKILTLLLSLVALTAAAGEQTISSPDGNYLLKVRNDDGRALFSVTYKGRAAVAESRLGLRANGRDWKEQIAVGEMDARHSVDTSWKPVYGERAVVRDRYNAGRIVLRDTRDQRRTLWLEVRAYDQGVAFRYTFPGGEYLNVTDEYTEYTFAEGTKGYYTSRAQTSYELLPLKDWPGECERPLVLELPDGLNVLLTEAGVVNWVRTKFALSADKPNTISSVMYGAADDIAPVSTPWRVVMAAEKPGELIENNDLLLNLNPPSRIENPWWIIPGKVMRETTLTTQGGKDVADFASRHGIRYMLFDAGWYGPEGSKASDATTSTLDPARNPVPDAFDLKQVIDYAAERNVKVILYVNQHALAQQLDELLPLYRSWGVAGIKFGFVMVGSQEWTHWMHEAVAKCAEYGLMVDIHNEYRPTGFSRTYPNLMTQEGIRGNEEFPDATHNATLPFTRFTQGAGDYTICYYRRDWTGDSKPDTSHGFVNMRAIRTTPSHQLALAVVCYSPLQMLYWYDKPSDYRGEPEIEFFDAVPTVWDDTRVIDGEIGSHVTIARRSGEEWYVGSIAGNEARKLSIPLTFLEPGKKYTANIYRDDAKVKTRTKVGIERIPVTSASVIAADLLPSGGQAMRIVPVR
jgi:alpha-glucosidase